ncbi:uncharacterized protein [Triticum aestivum]|uniref:Uncharacterized protein n=1 Tax=Triticum turgidum subsp. durum TaxID=4567 RepID=A0A9R1BB43_TRITD|nr:uncharacterized protein LOC123134190 isoform X2 [Triticum aestivum]VAI58089.1 unnamed protein product [Triticum turgidum subsp. durum]
MVRLRLESRAQSEKKRRMRFLGLVSLVALIFLLSFRSLLHQQVLVGEGAATASHDDGRRQHAKEWADERKRMRWFMTKDYGHPRRHTPRHNRLL